jgi:hypothetical protein
VKSRTLTTGGAYPARRARRDTVAAQACVHLSHVEKKSPRKVSHPAGGGAPIGKSGPTGLRPPWGTTMNTTHNMNRLVVGLATAVLASGGLGLSAIAHADYTSYTFLSPSGNIGCVMTDDGGGTIFAVCKTQDRTWAAPPSQYCQQGEVPGATGGPGSDLQLSQGKPPCVGFSMTQFFWSPDPLANHPTLDYGQSRSLGSITCNSETSGMTCTDSSTGHFFRVSSDSFQIG